jgi:hypothetical protein
MIAADLISVSAIVVGFGVTAVMFRVQRELYVLEVLKIKVLWLAWADYLIVGSIFLAVFGATIPLLVFPKPSVCLFSLAASSCVGALILQAGYGPSILAHYRIVLGGSREGPRARGEPIEQALVIGTSLLAAGLFTGTLYLRSSMTII